MIIAISGRTASGKTTLATVLAEELGGIAASFGDYVRKLAVELGRELDRPNLQEVGQAAVEADPEGFVADFMQWTGWRGCGDLIVEGLRHASVRDALRAQADAHAQSVLLVHVEADGDRRAERLRARGDDDAAIARHDAHPSEADVRDRLRQEADLRVTRGERPEEMVAAIIRHLAELQGTAGTTARNRDSKRTAGRPHSG